MRPWDIEPRLEALPGKLQRLYRHSELRKLRLWLKGKTLHWALYLAAATLLVGGVLGFHDYLRCFFYVVCVGEQEVGLVRDAGEINNFVVDLMERCSSLYGMEVEPAEAISLNWEYRRGDEPDAPAVKEALRQKITLVTDAVMVTVNGERVVPVVSGEEVDKVVELLSKAYVSQADNIKLLEVSLVENVTGVSCSVPPETVRTAEAAAALLQDDGRKREVIQIASRGVTEPGGEAAEQDGVIPVVHVITVEEVTAVEPIPFSTEYTSNSSMWYVQSRVVVPGREGSKQVVYHVTRENGKETARQKVSEQVLDAPTTCVIERGTARVPSMGTGQFTWPVEGGGRLTQGFRGWSHAGVDISYSSRANRYPRILAADSGVVVKTGSEWPMGNYIIIYHGRYYTAYLHNSSHLVSQGSTVSRGQPIAIMGNTGRTRGSDGIHLHFEVRISDGSGVWGHWRQHAPIDPLSMFAP